MANKANVMQFIVQHDWYTCQYNSMSSSLRKKKKLVKFLYLLHYVYPTYIEFNAYLLL